MGALNRNGGGDGADAALPRRVLPGRAWRAVRVTPAYTFATDAEGTVWAWGGAAEPAGPASGFLQAAYAGLGATPVARLAAAGSGSLQAAEETAFALLGAVDWVAGTPRTAWAGSAAPAGAAVTLPGAREIGTRFRVTSAQQAVGVRVHLATADVAAQTARLWRSDGTLLATYAFHRSPVPGDGVGSWLYATGEPVSLAPGADYVVSTTVPPGGRAVAEAGAGAMPRASGPLQLPPGWGVTGTSAGDLPVDAPADAAGYVVDPVLLAPQSP
nr:DUF4082 domain-containing protein [Motilibacter aurantiacus]